jgi:hypothetical protein
MTDELSQNSDPAPSDDELLMSALRTPAMSQKAMERVRATVEREWRAATTVEAMAGKPRTVLPSRVRWFAVAAAAVVAAAGVTSWVSRPPVQTAPVGSGGRGRAVGPFCTLDASKPQAGRGTAGGRSCDGRGPRARRLGSGGHAANFRKK